MLNSRLYAAALAGWTLSIGLSAQPAHRPIDFQREIRPILSSNCFSCHGPDQGSRMADLRLDTKEGAMAARKSGAAIVPGKPDASQLYQRITSEQKGKLMPPVHTQRTLAAGQKELLKRWIEQGAPWKEHWSFTTLTRPALPAVAPVSANAKWARNPIDRFVLARLDAAGLQPAPEAGLRQLARRAALDVTGLPPSPEMVQALVDDKGPQAYERYLDRLLESQQWGEHRARYWLDAARYADTHGIHVDNYREMWPYRDWVIKAFNKNLRFDQFVIEQLAGDLLPNPTADQLIATGFQRNNPTSSEDGAIAEEFEAIYAKDRVDTTSAVFLGLTLGCATCHDHKFDPLSQRDFYAMTAFFRNTTQWPFDGNIPDTPPILVVPDPQDQGKWAHVKSEETRLRGRLELARTTSAHDFAGWLDGQNRRNIKTPLEPADELLALTPAGIRVKGQPAGLKLPTGVTLGPAHIAGREALHFSGNAFLELPGVDAIQADQPFSVSMWFFLPKAEDSFIVASQTDPSSKGRGWSLDLTRRTPTVRLVGPGGRALSLSGLVVDRLDPARWYHLAFSYDGKRAAEGFRLFVNGKPARAQGSGKGGRLNGEIRSFSPFLIGAIGGASGDRFFDGGAIADLRVYARTLSDNDAALLADWPALELARQKPTADLTAGEREGFRTYYYVREHGDSMDLAAELQGVETEKLAILRRSAITHVQHEEPGMPSASVLFRGMYDQPRDRLPASTPGVLPPMAAGLPRNRMGLARWLVDAGNPLMTRVTVNRFWQEIFGQGLVRTSDDFGSQGETPSHPELLDWLAVEFREGGWDVKKFYKLLLTSATYRQAAVTTPLKLEKDVDNRLLSRGPRFRMDAEMVRDYALAASGLLVPAIGGPSVKPYQPDGVWEAVAMLGSNTRFYHRDSGDSLYRRSLYTFWKRSAPPPALEIFNAPTRENCTVRRERTNTPLQALATMNDVQYVEAARHLAQRALRAEPGNLHRQMRFLSGRLLARDLDERELRVTLTAHQKFLRFYDSRTEAARQLIAQGESKADLSLSQLN